MLKNNVSIMYVGGVDTGRILTKHARQRGWHVFHPAETMEALAMHVFYYPDIVVIDRSEFPIMAAEVAQHLRSLNDETPMLEVVALDAQAVLDLVEGTLETFTQTATTASSD